jgi:hypothetical protein
MKYIKSNTLVYRKGLRATAEINVFDYLETAAYQNIFIVQSDNYYSVICSYKRLEHILSYLEINLTY